MHKNNILRMIFIAVFLLTLTTTSAFGFIGGCTDSPEDPTIVLAILGCGAIGFPALWARMRHRRQSK
jgi:XrtJ-associated TM-motif-TM protein